MLGRQRLKACLERMLTAVAQPVVEVQDAPGLLLQAPGQHAHHGRDADAAGDEDRRDLGIGIDEEATGRRAHPKQVALLHPVMQMVGGEPGGRSGRSGGDGTRLTVMR